MTQDIFERVMNTNVTGVWLCAKHALPYLRESRSASIINAGSTSSISGYPQCQAYGASKGAVMQLTKMLAVDLAPDGIRVNCYCPGSIHTQIVDKFLEAAPDPELMLNTMTLTHPFAYGKTRRCGGNSVLSCQPRILFRERCGLDNRWWIIGMARY